MSRDARRVPLSKGEASAGSGGVATAVHFSQRMPSRWWSRGPGRQRRLVASVVLGSLVALFLSLTAVLYVWPAQNSLKGVKADAVLVMGGPGNRAKVALELAREHAAPVFLYSLGNGAIDCPQWHFKALRLQCFRPDPASTQGEARYAGAQARAHHWRSLIVVSSVAQDTRARLRVKRCFSGTVKVVTAPLSFVQRVYGVVYEWGATMKALLWQRSC